MNAMHVLTLYTCLQANHVSLDNLDQGLASNYSSEVRTEIASLSDGWPMLSRKRTRDYYQAYTIDAALFARRLAYRAEGQPFFKLIDPPCFNLDIDTYEESIAHPYLAARILWLKQRRAGGQEQYPTEGHYHELTLEYESLRKGLSDRMHKEYLDEKGSQSYTCLEWYLFARIVSYLTCCRYKQAEFIGELDAVLDERSVALSETSSYDGNDDEATESENDHGADEDNDDMEDTVPSDSQDSDSDSDMSSEVPPSPRARRAPIYPAVPEFTTPCTQEAMAASDETDRRCYACYYDYGVSFSHSNRTEPAVRTPCGHVHGTICLKNHLKKDRATCPVCRERLFGFDQRLDFHESGMYVRLVQAIDGIAKLDPAIDRYLLEGQKEVHNLDFANLLRDLFKLCARIITCQSELRKAIPVEISIEEV